MSKQNKRKCATSVPCAWDEPKGYNVHHRLPKSRGGSNNPINLSRVPVAQHNAFNLLFGGNPTPQEVALVLTNIWIDPKYEIICKLRDEPE